jgi:hypothetical protein
VPTSRNIRIRIFAPNTPGTYPNLAKVDPDGVIAEGNEFDNASQIETTVTVGGNNMFNELNLTKVQSDPADECGGVKCVATSSVVTSRSPSRTMAVILRSRSKCVTRCPPASRSSRR